MFDVDAVEAVLVGAARAGAAVTYADALAALGHRFTRPRMRQLCVALDAVDARGRGSGRPEFAVLVVRQSDGLPGQGWWTGRRDWDGRWSGPEALAYVRGVQARAFAWAAAHCASDATVSRHARVT